MLRTLALRVALTGSLAVLGTTAALAQGATIRIEPRPFYGATITLEEGVRVFRPLPPDRYVIINPGNRTPLNLSINESRVYEQSDVHHHNAAPPSDMVGRSGGYYGGLPLYGNGYFGRPGGHGKHDKPLKGL